jgi:hypothetical protein
MRYTKGKWQASYKDTFSLDTTLSPIIYAGLQKFHDVLEQRYKEDKCIGIPIPYCSDPEAPLPDEEVQAWLDDIKKMMYAFENKEPDMSLYDFKMFRQNESGIGYSLGCTNEEEKARYYADCDEHERLVQEGLNIFSLRYGSLWW